MEIEQMVVGFILFVFGGFTAIKPEVFIRFQVWVQKNIMGAVYEPSERTYKIVRVFGVIMVILGLLNLVGRL